MSWISFLPTLNAALNTCCTILLVTGYILIRKGRRQAHRKVMLGALAVSMLFLTSYVIYHGARGSTPFPGQGTIRWFYFTLLLTHVILAATIVPLVLITVRRALKGKTESHRKLARWTLPLWLYVSVTGVVIYGMLYHL